MAKTSTPIKIFLTPAERSELEHRSRGHCRPHRDVVRAKIILLLSEGVSVSETGRRVEKTRKIIRKWGERFVKKRLAGLSDKAGRGREPLFSPSGGGVSGQAGLRAA